MTIALYCVIFGLIGIIFIQDRVHYKERRDLYNRIMCGSMKEYQNIDKPERRVKSRHRELLDNWRAKEVE